MNVFIIVERYVYEGFLVHGIFSSLNNATNSVSKLQFATLKDTKIEELKMNEVFKINSYENNTNLNDVIHVYDLNGNKIR